MIQISQRPSSLSVLAAVQPLTSRSVVQPQTWVTMMGYPIASPVKAVFKGKVTCTALGAAGQANLRDPSNTFNIRSWTATGSTSPEAQTLLVGTYCYVEIVISPQQTLITTQDIGTNSEFNFNGVVEYYYQ